MIFALRLCRRPKCSVVVCEVDTNNSVRYYDPLSIISISSAVVDVHGVAT